MILPADKGKATVVINRRDYEKMETLSSDRSTYQPLRMDPTPGLQRKMNALLLKLKMKGELSAPLSQMFFWLNTSHLWSPKDPHTRYSLTTNSLLLFLTHVPIVQITCGNSFPVAGYHVICSPQFRRLRHLHTFHQPGQGGSGVI